MSRRSSDAIELSLLAALFAWLLWLPLPFGSNVPAAWLPLLVPPLAICGLAAAWRYRNLTPERTFRAPLPWRAWLAGVCGLIAVGMLQLVPLPPSIVALLSPEAATLWSRVAAIGGALAVGPPAQFALSVDPGATTAEVLRLTGLAAAFVSGSLLVRTHRSRVILAAVLCLAAAFQVGYGIREAAMQRYEIWGWRNVLVHSRVTGTFVNPNHFAHYLAIILPMPLFIVASLWREAAPSGATLKRRAIKLAEKHLLAAGLAFLSATAIVATVLLSRSRGGILALCIALAAVAALVSRRTGARLGYAAGAAVLLLVTLVLYLGPARTIERFGRSGVEDGSLNGRRVGLLAAVGVWQRFPLFGSGAGTFQSVVMMEQEDVRSLQHRAHNDYAELAATQGAVGFLVALVALSVGYRALIEMTIGRGASVVTWRRRAFQVAALTSLTVAMVHGLFDFNFFIPSNPATLAVILGAAVSPLDHDTRNRL